jgi:cytochrome c553
MIVVVIISNIECVLPRPDIGELNSGDRQRSDGRKQGLIAACVTCHPHAKLFFHYLL